LVVAFLGRDMAAEQAAPSRPFARLVEDYFDAYFAWKPWEGTAAGFHQYDTRLEDWSADATRKRVQTVRGLLARFNTLLPGKLTEVETIDAEILQGLMQAELLDLVTLARWRKNPMNYISTPAGAIDGLMKRSFAPPGERLRSVIARLKATPALF